MSEDVKKEHQESLEELENAFGRGLVQPQRHKKKPLRSF